MRQQTTFLLPLVLVGVLHVTATITNITTAAPVSTTAAPVDITSDKGEDDLSEAYLPNLRVALGFTIICTSSYYFGNLVPTLKLPKITGYLLMGILAGPFVLNLVPKSEIRSLRAVDECSLAFIAVAAGGKIYLKKMKPIQKPLMWICLFLIVLEYIVGFR